MNEKIRMKPGRHVISRGAKFEEVVYITMKGKRAVSVTKHERIKAASNEAQ